MSGISEEERLRLEEERLAKTMLNRASGKKMNFVAKPAEAKAPAAAPKNKVNPPRTGAAPRAIVHTAGAQDSPTMQREEDRLVAALSKPHGEPAPTPSRFKVKELSEEDKARIKAHEELMHRREEEAKATAELERKQAERRTQDEAERKNRSYNSYFYGTEIKPFRSGGDSQVPEPIGQPPPNLAKAPLQDFTSTLLALTHGFSATTSSPAPAVEAPKPVPKVEDKPKVVEQPNKVEEKPKAAAAPAPIVTSSSSTSNGADGELPAQSKSMKNLYKAFTNNAPVSSSSSSSVSPAPSTSSSTSSSSISAAPAVVTASRFTPSPSPAAAPAPVVRAAPVSTPPASDHSFLPPPTMVAPPPPTPTFEEPPRATTLKSRIHTDLDDIDALISGIDKSVAESAADVARKEVEHRRREEERQQREAEEARQRKADEDRRRVEVALKVEEQRVQLERERKEREVLEEAKKKRIAEEEERRMQYNAEYDRRQAEKEEDMQRQIAAARMMTGVNLSLDEKPKPVQAEEQHDPSVGVRQLALQSIHASTQRLRMAELGTDIEATEHLRSLPSTSSGLTELLVPFLQPGALEALRSNQIEFAAMAGHLARVTEAAHYASIVSPHTAEQLIPLADDLLTQASALVATAGAWIHTGGDGNHVQENCKAMLATLLQLIRATKAALSTAAPSSTLPVYVSAAPAAASAPRTPDKASLSQAPQLQPPQLQSPFSGSQDEDAPAHNTAEFVNNITASGKRLLTLVNSFSDGADIGSTIAAFVDSLQAVQTNVSEVAMVFNADDGKTLVEQTKGLMQHGLDFVRIVRMHSTQGTPLDFDRASTQVRGQLLELLRSLANADKNHKSGAPTPAASSSQENPAVAELNAHGRRLEIILNEPELDGDGFIAEMKLVIGVARNVQQPLPDSDAKDRIAVSAKTLLQRGIAYRTAQSAAAKKAVTDAVAELSAAVAAV